MKKRIISLLLCLSILFGFAVPTMTPQTDAANATVTVDALSMCASLVSGCIKASQNMTAGSAGHAVLGLLKYTEADLTGNSLPEETVIQKVAPSQVETVLKNINTTLQTNNVAIYQLQSTVSDKLRSMSKEMDSMTLADANTKLQYSTYLDTFFDFFSEYYEGISYYDKLVTTMLASGATEEYQKNIYDQFYQLQNVEYSGTLHSAVNKLGQYLQGKNIDSSPGSVIDILTKYYILGYKDNGMSEEDARAKAAENTQDIISYLYYAYVMGAYYEQAIALYQTGIIDENGGVYTTDFGTKLTQDQIDTTVTALWGSVELTAGCILADMRSNYHHDDTIPLVYQTSSGKLLTRTVDYSGFAAENGCSFWLEDPAEELKTYFGDKFCDAFSGIAKLNSENYRFVISDNYYVHIKSDSEIDPGSSGSSGGNTIAPINPSATYTVGLDVTVGGQTIHTYSLQVYKQLPSDFSAGIGTEDYPYMITTTEQFERIKDHSDAHFALGNDLDFGGKTITPIEKFSGSLDGNGFIISNCWVTVNSDSKTIYAGLFGELTGTVRNLQVEKVNVNAASTNTEGTYTAPSKLYAGTIAGYVNDGTLLYCSVSDSSVYAQNSSLASGIQSACYVGGVVGGSNNATLTNVVCRDTSVTASARGLTCGTNNSLDTDKSGWAFAGGLAGLCNDTEVVRCGYTQSEDSNKDILATGVTGACAGGLIGYTNKEVTVAWVTLANAPVAKADSQASSYNNNCFRYGSIVGCASCELHTVYKYWSSYPADKKIVQTELCQDGSYSWQFGWTTKNVKTVNEEEISALFDTYFNASAIKEKYLTFDGFQEIEDGSGLTPLFRYGSADSAVFDKTLLDFPDRKTYVEGNYIDLTGLYSYQCVGEDKLEDITYPYVHVSEGSDLLNTPLTTGTHTIRLSVSNTSTVSFEINVQSTSHIYLEAITTEPTCTEGGESIQTCLHCGLQKEPEMLEKLGHDEVLIDQGYPATCTTDGKLASYRCSRCGKESGGWTILGMHVYSEHVDGYPATCNKDGMTEGYICAKCGAVGSGCEPIPATGKHRAVKVEGYAATCLATGLTDGEICGDCETVLKEQTVIPLADHKTETVTILEPTCVSGGVKQEKCTVCGEVISLTNLKALGHDYQSTVTVPTCEEPGYTSHTCTQCGVSYVDSYTAPTNHHYGKGTVTKAATCTAEGEMTYTCTCGKTHTEPIPMIDHDYVASVTAPTCTEMGYTTHTCTQCSDHYTDTYTAPKGHTWDKGETVTAPTLISTGILRQSCTVCGETHETVIPALDKCDGGMDCPSRKFKDVQGIEHWSHLGIDYVLRSSFFYGVTSEQFAPNRPMTRAMLVVVMYRMDGQPSVDGLSHNFQDVPKDAWYEDALIWACNNGVINGVTASTFDPNSNITRQQMAAILYRYAQLREYNVSDTADLSEFKDYDTVGKFAQPAMSWAVANGLVQGYTDGTLKPKDSATRAQLAAILMRFMKNVVGK